MTLQENLNRILQDTQKSRIRLLKENLTSNENHDMVTTITYLRTLVPKRYRYHQSTFDITHQIIVKFCKFEIDIINSSNNITTYQVSAKELNEIFNLLETKLKESA